MELEDGLDELLAQISEPSSPKKLKQDDAITVTTVQPGTSMDAETKPGTSNDAETKPASSKTHCVLVNQKQRGNPLLKSITCVPWEYDDIIPDYEIGRTIGILFLSVRYHNINPDYINNRLKELGRKYDLRVLLVQVDMKEPHKVLKNLTRICLLTDMTLMLAWSPEEAGKVVENYKIFENTPPDKIMERIENDPHQRIVNALSSIRPVNKTDALTLIANFGTLENIVKASEARLAECPGFGATKAKKLHKALHEKFLKKPPAVQRKEKEFEEDLNLDDVEKAENEIKEMENEVANQV